MPTHDELEQLSRLASGELSAPEAARLEAEVARRPDLARALDDLRLVLSTAAALSVELPEADQARLVGRVLAARPPPLRRAWAVRLGVAAAAAVVLLGLGVLLRDPGAELRAPEGLVSVNGAPAATGTALPPGALVETGADSTATLVRAGLVAVVAPNSRVLARSGQGDEPIELSAGALFVQSAERVHLRAGSAEVSVLGSALVTAEPVEHLDRVTARLNLQSPVEEAHVRSQLLKVSLPVVVVGALTTAAIAVYSGSATAGPPGQSAVELVAPARWQAPQPAGQMVVAAPADLRLEAAEAEVVALRGEVAALKKQLAQLTPSAAGDPARKATANPPIRGSVVDALGRPAGHVAMVLVSGDHQSETFYSDADGRFSLDDVGGRGLLYAHKDGKSSLTQAVEPGSNVPVKLEEPATIHARVTIGGSPATGSFKVWTAPGRIPAILPGLFGGMKAFTGDRFELERPVGEVELHVVSDGAPSLAGHALVRVQPGAGNDVTIELTPAEGGVRGRVVNAATGKGVRTYEVKLLMADNSPEAAYPPGTPDFSFGGRSAGERVVLITAEGFEPLRVPATITANQMLDLGDLALKPR